MEVEKGGENLFLELSLGEVWPFVFESGYRFTRIMN